MISSPTCLCTLLLLFLVDFHFWFAQKKQTKKTAEKKREKVETTFSLE